MSSTKNMTFETAVQEWLAPVQPKAKITACAQYILGNTGAYLYCSKDATGSRIEATNLISEEVG